MPDEFPTYIQLQIVTPERAVAEEEVDEVSIPGKEGYFGVLPGHAPLITELQSGTLTYRQNTSEHYVAINQGFAEVLPDRVIVLAEGAERAEEINVDQTESEIEDIESYLRSNPESEADVQKAQYDLRKAKSRLETARHLRS